MPLSDVRVIDCGQVIAGPLCATFLGDMGADVVKVEPPTGETYRTERRQLNGEPFSPPFELYNRNKRALALNLKHDDGLAALYDLVEVADIFVQNWPPGVAKRLGVDYETLRELNPDLVYVHITGYGETGPMANNPGLDTLVQHLSGFAQLHGYPDSDRPPIRSQSSLADYFAAYSGALSAMGALRAADRGEGGQLVDVSLLESLAHNMDAAYEYYNNLGEKPRAGGRNAFFDPDMLYGAAAAADGYICVGLLLYSDRIWEGLCTLLDRPDLFADERYATDAGRMADAEKLTGLFEEWLSTVPAEKAVETLNAHNIPAARSQTIAEAAAMEQYAHRETFVTIDHDRFGELSLTASPLSLSRDEISVRRPAPRLGEHSRELLAELYDEETVEKLFTDGVIHESG
ncbi:CaiB/BaiF CoA transferase family protein [Haladaptatus sp. CMSO5]|uniref:CaiB/BaiF CoA transferase family protein n=1 Tax=Haladaptatus sp. CMSO5 TaxID=3120514 RepID=UPI002FCE587C